MNTRLKYRPYIRRANGREYSSSFRVCVRLAFHKVKLRRPYYVLVQRGFPLLALDCAATREELEKTPFPVAAGEITFREWAKRIQTRAEGKPRSRRRWIQRCLSRLCSCGMKAQRARGEVRAWTALYPSALTNNLPEDVAEEIISAWADNWSDGRP